MGARQHLEPISRRLREAWQLGRRLRKQELVCSSGCVPRDFPPSKLLQGSKGRSQRQHKFSIQRLVHCFRKLPRFRAQAARLPDPSYWTTSSVGAVEDPSRPKRLQSLILSKNYKRKSSSHASHCSYCNQETSKATQKLDLEAVVAQH